MSNSSRKLLILCDGTGNEIDHRQSNVLRLYRVLRKTAEQRVFYDPGIGTMGSSEDWVRWKANTERVLGLIAGYGLDENVLTAYRFLLREYRPGDRVYLFGYSRGAYTVRVLAGFINAVGILQKDQHHLLPYAYNAYKQISEDGDFGHIRQFERILRPYRPAIEFMGLWDSVSSILVPRKDRLHLPTRRQLAFTERNPSVKTVCHALAIDERRRMFQPYLWPAGKPCWGGPFEPAKAEKVVPQNVRELWFPGVHSDVGGGRPEAQSALAKISLQWMCEQIEDELDIVPQSYRRIVQGQGSDESIAPDACAPMHNSMTGVWKLLEYLPKRKAAGAAGLPWYLPCGEARKIPADAALHASVQQRIDAGIGYQPTNIS